MVGGFYVTLFVLPNGMRVSCGAPPGQAPRRSSRSPMNTGAQTQFYLEEAAPASFTRLLGSATFTAPPPGALQTKLPRGLPSSLGSLGANDRPATPLQPL
jgi:hypothetical protein